MNENQSTEFTIQGCGEKIIYYMGGGLILAMICSVFTACSNDSDYDPFGKSVSSRSEMVSALSDPSTEGIFLTSNINCADTPVTIAGKNVIIDGGDDHRKIANSSFTVQEQDAHVTFRNLTFDKVAVMNRSGQNDSGSLIYTTTGYTGALYLENCVFDGSSWDAIQSVPESGAKYVINGCTFKMTKNVTSLPAYSKNKLRHIHIEAGSPNTQGISIRITNNTFLDCKKMVNAVIDIDYIDMKGVTASGNTFDDKSLATNNNTKGVGLSIWPSSSSVWKCSDAYTFFTTGRKPQ